MNTLHILINPDKEMIVNAVHDDQMRDGLKHFIRHHTNEQGQPLARIIVKKGSPIKVIQAGEEA
jgi:hypothetical protein